MIYLIKTVIFTQIYVPPMNLLMGQMSIFQRETVNFITKQKHPVNKIVNTVIINQVHLI